MVRDQAGSMQHWSHVTWEEGSSSPRALPGSMVSQASPMVFVNRMCSVSVEVVFVPCPGLNTYRHELPLLTDGKVLPVRSPVTYLVRYATSKGYADFAKRQ